MNFKGRKFYKIKNSSEGFLCALCSSERTMKYKKNLSLKNYLQLTLLGGSLTYFLFPIFGLKSLFLTFVIWLVVEVANKMLYRNELPCPYCGFDATWYKRDVKIARKRVEDFWTAHNLNSNKNSATNSSDSELQDKVQNLAPKNMVQTNNNNLDETPQVNP